MALFRQLLTARQSVIIDDIETLQSQISSKEDDITALQGRLDSEVAKINALQSLTTSHTSQLNTTNDTLALKLQIENEKNKIVALQSLTESHTSQISSNDDDITDLQGWLDIEETKIIDLEDLTANHTDDINALQTPTASHADDIATNTAVMSTKQDGITTSTDLECNSFATSNLVVKGEKFDTILIRRTDAVPVIVNLRTLQIYVNNVNIIESATSSTQSTGIVGGAIGNVIEFITWNNLLTSNQHNAPTPFYASKIRNNIVNTSHSIFSFNLITPYISLYIPLTQTFNISDIQSFVLYNRNNNASDQLRIQGFQIELYNRSNGFTAGENILYTMPINTSAPVYRFDLPSISTYTLGLSDDDSQSFVKDIAVSDSFRTILLNVEDGNVDLGGNLIITGDLVVGDVNIITEINTKQDLILDGALTIAKTDGLLTALNSTAKLDSANTFTG